MSNFKKVIFIQGTTASGKSHWALELAQKYGGAIVNCDSIQVYKEIEIGTAKPSLEERALVPHYLFDFISPPHEYTAGEYTRDFFKTLSEMTEAVVWVVGGTGFYFQAIEKGMYPIRKADPKTIAEIEGELVLPGGAEKLYKELQVIDPEFAKKISPNDHYRLARALEVFRTEGKNITQVQSEFSSLQKPFPFPLLKLGVKRSKEQLLESVAVRSQKMLALGLIDEVQAMLAKGYKDWSPLQSVGYKEVVQFLNGELQDHELESKIVQGTMRLAKKQRTWFQRDSQIEWFEFSERQTGLRSVEEFLSSSQS